MTCTFIVLVLGLSLNASADTFLLKDGTKLEGEAAGEMDGTLLVKTKYGSLTINKADIKEQLADTPYPQAQTSTQTAVFASTGQPAAAAAISPSLTFTSVQTGAAARILVYYENSVVIATETFNADGALAALSGAIKDGTYTEHYSGGPLKTVKTMAGGKASGALKAYYPSGAVQIEASYLAGKREGPFKYYAEDGKLLMEAAYSDDKLNGWKKEYDSGGAVKTEAYYAQDHVSEPPKAPAPPEAALEPDSLVTAKVMSLARGERFSFRLNGKYIGKAHLDRDFNIISQDGKIPDGTVKVYSKEGKLQKEIVFEKSGITLLRVYEDGGPLKAAYTFNNGKAFPYSGEKAANP